MPLVDRNGSPIADPKTVNMGVPYGVADEDSGGETPSFGETLGSIYRLNSTWAPLASYRGMGPKPEFDENFNPWNYIKGTELEPYWDRFADARNPADFENIRRDIEFENDARQTLQRSGTVSYIGGALLAGITDPTVLIPGVAAVRGPQLGYSTIKTALMTGALTAGTVATQEAFLHASQQTRTLGESATNIFGATIIGSLMGAGFAKLLSNAERDALSLKLFNEMQTGPPGNPEKAAVDEAVLAVRRNALASGGAAATPVPELKDLGISNVVARMVTRAAPFNPIARAFGWASAEARSLMFRLAETPVYLTGTERGVTPGPAVENLIRQWHGQYDLAVEGHLSAWRDYRKAGGQLTRSDFGRLVGQAARREDASSDIPEVARAAKLWRSQVIDPLTQAAQKAGLYPEDLEVTTAPSYFTRVWNRKQLAAEEFAFKKVVKSWAQSQAGATDKKLRERTEAVTKALDAEASDLNLKGPARAWTLSKLDEIIAEHQANPQINAFIEAERAQRQAAEALKDGTGSKAAVDAAQAKVDTISRAGGEELQFNRDQLRRLTRRRRNIRLNIEGSEGEIARLKNRIERADQMDLGRLRRYAGQVADLEAKIAKGDPEKLAGEIKALNSKLAEMIAQSERQADKLDQMAGASKSGPLTADVKAGEALKAKEEKISRLADKIERLSERDPEAAVKELRGLIEERTASTLDRVRRSNEAINRASERIESLDPKLLKERLADIETRKRDAVQKLNERLDQLDAENGYEDYAQKIADNMFDSITGRGGSMAEDFAKITVAARGPLKERTFNMPDELVERWLDSDVERVMAKFTRVLASDVELANNFPDSIDAGTKRATLAGPLQKVVEDYKKIREDVNADPNLTPQQKEARFGALEKEEKRALNDLSAMRDMLRGTYAGPLESRYPTFAKLVRIGNAFNYVRTGGDFVISSLTDIVQPMIKHGMAPYLTGLARFATSPGFRAISRQEAKRAGTIGETAKFARLASWTDIADPHGQGTMLERFSTNANRVMARASGIALWNDWQKSFAASMTETKLVKNIMTDWDKLSKLNQRYMAHVGIDRDMHARMRTQVEGAIPNAPGEAGKVGDFWHSGTDHWNDQWARRVFWAAIDKDVSATIITPSIGDLPLFMHNPVGKMLLQYRSFTLASHQKLLVRAIQEGANGNQLGVAGGILSGVLIGMFISYLKAIETNRLDEMSDNPAAWITDGIDRSGILSILMEASGTSEKMGGPGVYTLATKLFPDADQQAGPSRFASRGPLGSLLGPTAGSVEDAARIWGWTWDPKKKPIGAKALLTLLPGRTLPYIRPLLEWGLRPQLEAQE